MRKLGWWFSVFVALAGANAFGAETNQVGSADYFFQCGKYEATLNGGVMFSPIAADNSRHTVDYTSTGLQLGYMLTDLNSPDAWYRGNLELLGEAFGGAVYKGKGSYIVMGTIYCRYNFAQPNWKLVPYVQAGAGMGFTDMDQRLVGQKFNFNLDVGIGARYFVARDLAISAECRYQHISNARLADHDIGANALGPIVGISYFF